MSFDLSKLPFPTCISETNYESILQELIKEFQKLYHDYDAVIESDSTIIMLEACAYLLAIHKEERNQSIKSILLAFSQNEDLENLAALFSVKRAEKETDERLKERILYQLDKTSTCGVKDAYEILTLEADAKILDVVAYDKKEEPAKAFISVQLPNFSDEELKETTQKELEDEILNNVKKYLNDEERKPLGVQIIVEKAQKLEFEIYAKIVIDENVEKNTVLNTIKTKINELIEQRKRINKTIALSEIYAVINIEGIAFVDELILPKNNIKSLKTHYPFCTKINIEEVENE